MTPKRKANGYEKNGKKKYRRFYFIESMDNVDDESNSTTSSNSAETDAPVQVILSKSYKDQGSLEGVPGDSSPEKSKVGVECLGL